MGGAMGMLKSSDKPDFAEAAGAKIGGGTKGGDDDSVVLKLTEHQLEEFRECFNAFDKDGGGSIDSTELGAQKRI